MGESASTHAERGGRGCVELARQPNLCEMSRLVWLAASLGLLLAVLALAAVAKVRIDARASIESARSLRGRARTSHDERDWQRCGEAFVAVLRSYSPFDPTLGTAVAELREPARELPVAAAVTLVDAAIAEIDLLPGIIAPLRVEREELGALRVEVLERQHRAVSRPEDLPNE